MPLRYIPGFKSQVPEPSRTYHVWVAQRLPSAAGHPRRLPADPPHRQPRRHQGATRLAPPLPTAGQHWRPDPALGWIADRVLCALVAPANRAAVPLAAAATAAGLAPLVAAAPAAAARPAPR